ncbi:MAG: hypothetical protein KatS3mg102_1089 [Planctomycetota bacterium]|nr:MAG: hypothetical protein KatS3mg102_1089 [Planctomycetota bacterium]
MQQLPEEPDSRAGGCLLAGAAAAMLLGMVVLGLRAAGLPLPVQLTLPAQWLVALGLGGVALWIWLYARPAPLEWARCRLEAEPSPARRGAPLRLRLVLEPVRDAVIEQGLWLGVECEVGAERVWLRRIRVPGPHPLRADCESVFEATIALPAELPPSTSGGGQAEPVHYRCLAEAPELGSPRRWSLAVR